MKLAKQIGLATLLGAGITAAAGAGTVPNEINPALLYYQAFLVAPQMTESEMDYLGTNAWGNQKLSAHYSELVAGYDDEFKLVRLAARSGVPCDWGLDMSSWPATIMPGYARAKAVAVASRSRVVWELQQGQQAAACDDWLATFALARNVSRDGTIISVLVQIAMESICTWNIAEHFGEFTPESLQQIVEGIDTAPARGTLAAAVTNEAVLSRRWLVGVVENLRKTYPDDDAKVMAGLREMFAKMRGKELAEDSPWDKFIQAAQGSSAGILKLVSDAEPVYERLVNALSLPLAEYQAQEKALEAQFAISANPLLASFPAMVKAKRREARSLVTLAMVRAAAQYKLHGMAGLQTVTDPAGTGPFGFGRFVVRGVDRGFQLSSVLDAGGFKETLVFVETPGPAFLVGGPHVGQERGQ